MEAKELRVGNLLMFNGEISEVACIHNDDTIRFVSKEDPTDTHGCYGLQSHWNIKPVPLTAELLQTAGFTVNNYGTLILDLDRPVINHICYSNGDLYFSINQDEFIEDLGIKYIHELQNLVFGLTKKELAVRITPALPQSE